MLATYVADARMIWKLKFLSSDLIWYIYIYIYKFTSECHSQTTPSSEWRQPGPGNVFITLCWQANPQLWHRVLKHHPSLSTLRPKGLSLSKMKWWAIYANLPVNAIVRRLPHPRGRESQGQEMFLALSADKQTYNYDIECSNHHPSLLTLRLKGLSLSKMKWWAIYTNLPVNAIVRLTTPSSEQR